MRPDRQIAGCQARRRVIRQQQRGNMLQRDSKRLHFPRMQGKEPGHGSECGRNGLSWFDLAQRYNGLTKRTRPVPLHFAPDLRRHQYSREVSQQIQAPQFVQMNQRTRVAYDQRRSLVSLVHEDPTRRLP